MKAPKLTVGQAKVYGWLKKQRGRKTMEEVALGSGVKVSSVYAYIRILEQIGLVLTSSAGGTRKTGAKKVAWVKPREGLNK